MKTEFETLSRTAIVVVMGLLLFYMIYAMAGFGERQSAKQTDSIKRIVDKALVQCYALEGAYPPDIEYVEKYGVVFDHEQYIYYYEWYGGNLQPSVTIVEK